MSDYPEHAEQATANPYEAACERFNRASANWPKAKAEAEQLLREADDEWNAARANLRQYEQSPGIPLPQYRTPLGTSEAAPAYVACSAIAGHGDDEAEPCGKPSRFLVERSDGDRSYGINGGSDESCEEHLTETVAGMIDGDENVRAVVTIRWDK